MVVWHGRNSYKRSAKLAQFVIHRGLIISVCQTVYSITYAYAPIALYQVPQFWFLKLIVGMALGRIRYFIYHDPCLQSCS
jgi:magnesium-transporting ATPase (P-type)